MRGILIFVFLLFSLANGNGEDYPVAPTDSNNSFISSLATKLVDCVSRAIQYFYEFWDLNVRSAKFLGSLYTTDNLVLLKKYINVALRFGGWVYERIPNSTKEGNHRILSLIFPQLDIRGGGEEDDEEDTTTAYYDETTSVTTNSPTHTTPDYVNYHENDIGPRSSVSEGEERYRPKIINLNTIIKRPR